MIFDPKRLRDARHEARLSRKAVALAIGRSLKTIQNWEDGVFSPDMKDGAKLAMCLSVPITRFFREEVADDAAR